jgi:hypothetical protein
LAASGGALTVRWPVGTKQISVFLENRRGRLAEVIKLLAEEKINIRGFSLADMADLGVLRLIVNDPERCLKLLAARAFAVQETEVVAVEVEDQPGALHKVIEVLNAADVNIEQMYAIAGKKAGRGVVVLKMDAAEAGIAALNRNGITVLSEDAAAL